MKNQCFPANRDNELKELGIQVIRFTNEEVFFDIEKVLEKIAKALNND